MKIGLKSMVSLGLGLGAMAAANLTSLQSSVSAGADSSQGTSTATPGPATSTSTTPSTPSATSTVSYPAPPSTFSPLTASSAELAQYGFPQEPPNGTARSLWLTAATSYRSTVTTTPAAVAGLGISKSIPQLTGTSTNSAETSQNWSGHVVTSSQMQGGTLADGVAAEWVVPTVPYGSGTGGCGVNDVSPIVATWVGLDGVAPAGDLIQAGTDSWSCSGSAYRFWTESLPNEGSAVFQGPWITGGDEVIVWVTHNAVYTGGTSTYFLENVTTGTSQSFYSYSTPWSGATADFVAERPLFNVYGGIFLSLPDYNYTYFSSCIYATFGGWQNLVGGSGGNDNFTMTQHANGTGPTLATASSVSSQVFTSLWQDAGSNIPLGS